MSEQKPKSPWLKNALVIFLMAAAAVGLALAARAVPQNNPTSDEVRQQMAALATPAPEAPASTDAPQAAAEAEAYLFIIVNNRVSGIYALGEEGDVTVDQGDGVVNVIHLLPDGFYMASSTCDNQLCVMEGTVTVDNYQSRILGASILCLPHNLDLELVVPSHTPDPNAPDI